MFNKSVKEELNIELSDAQIDQFNKYYDFLIAYNRVTNLTRITEKEDVFYKHFYDSMTLVKSIDLNSVQTLCDMGAGAGFPSIPLKIIFPHLKITIIDSLGKRITFLKQLLELLSIDNVDLVYDRIENHAQNHRELYDVVTARALGKLPLILELGMPMIKTDGHFIAYKTSNYEDELFQSTDAIKLLGGKLKSITPIKLPDQYGDRTHIIISKIKKSPSIYPRSFSAIKKKSL